MAIFSKKENTAEKEETKLAATSPAAFTVQVPTILLSPRISEKASHLAEQNKYVFNVKKKANKVEIKKAVEGAYKVKVIQVNIVNSEGKSRIYGRTKGKMSDFKKAIVTLKKGDKIEGVTDVA